MIMTRAKNPVGLPHSSPTKSYWQTPPDPISNHRSYSTLPQTSDYVIVGSGITGASIAYKFLQRNQGSSVVLLEAGEACSRDSGRNGGHCKPGNYKHFKRNMDKYGLEDAKRVWKLEQNNVKGVTDEIKWRGIKCNLQSVETADVIMDPVILKQCLESIEAIKDAFPCVEDATFPHKVLTAEEARDQLLMPDACGAITFPAFSLHPYKLVCRVLEMALDHGLNLQTNTPVIEVEHRDNGWAVRTYRGTIVAKNVILATNAYTVALYPPLAAIITPVRGQVVAMRPGSRISGNPILKRTFAPKTPTSLDYFITRAEGLSGAGDVIFGGGWETPSVDDSMLEPELSGYLINAPRRYFGEGTWGENGEVVQQWSGILCRTPDGHPIIGQAPGPKGLWVCAAFNGHGMALTWQSAEALVQLLLGEDVDWLPQCYKIERFSFDWKV